MYSVVVVVLVGTLAWGDPEPFRDVEINASWPPSGAVDVREDRDAELRPTGLQWVVVEFDRPVVLTQEAIRVISNRDPAPRVSEVAGEGSTWQITVDRPLAGGESWAILFGDGRLALTFAALPGDVNRDRVCDDLDVRAQKAAVRSGTEDLDSFDIDRDGEVDEGDLRRLEVLLSGSDGGKPWLGESLAADDPSLRCCCLLGFCTPIIASACPMFSVEVPCPCQNDSCNGVGS